MAPNVDFIAHVIVDVSDLNLVQVQAKKSPQKFHVPMVDHQ